MSKKKWKWVNIEIWKNIIHTPSSIWVKLKSSINLKINEKFTFAISGKMTGFVALVALDVLSSVSAFRAVSWDVSNLLAVVAFSWLNLSLFSGGLFLGAFSGHMSRLLTVVTLGTVCSGGVGSLLSFAWAVSGHMSWSLTVVTLGSITSISGVSGAWIN